MRRPGLAPAIVGVLLLLQLAAAAVLVTADATGIWIHGARYDGACAMRQYLGIPCPTCGMTRSVVLTLHGRIGDALTVNPAGPFWAAAVLATGMMLLLRRRWTGRVALAGGGAFALVAAVHWLQSVLVR